MPELVWHKPGTRMYESGLDRGVLYLPDGSAVPWNGLTSITESTDKSSTSVYYDGVKINDFVTIGSFAATMRALTYPDEFLPLEGLAEMHQGVFAADQPPQFFGLCYRTRISNDIEPDAGYKIHILYNVTAIPSQKEYATLGADVTASEFEWSISAVPEEVPKFRPTSHIIIDTRDIDPTLMKILEDILYGSEFTNARLIPMAELVAKIYNFLWFEVFDHGDGTWSVETDLLELVTLGADGHFEIVGIDARYISADTYTVENTEGEGEGQDWEGGQPPPTSIFQIRITTGVGTWTATTRAGDDALITTVGQGLVQIQNATIRTIDANTYELSDTIIDG